MTPPRRTRGPAASSTQPRSPGARVVLGFVTLVAVLVALGVALAGAWIGTSLAVFHDGPVWLAIVGAVVCFFLVPLGWELLADRHQVGGRLRDAILRSALLSLAFVVILLATQPQAAFKALATRGDWFLGGSRSASAESVRGFLHSAANRLEWLYELARAHAFSKSEDPSAAAASHTPTPSASTRVSPPRSQVEPRGAHVGRLATYTVPGSTLTWPLPATPHPAVLALPEAQRSSVAAVGRWLAEQEPDLHLRAKALHDFTATWVAYDVEALRDGSAHEDGKQGAERVFRDRKAVCAGYANLMVALGRAAGLKVVYIGGDSRSIDDYEALAPDEVPRSDEGHAWNAVEIEGQWHLLDATWDAGHVGSAGFSPRYQSTYLFIPPEAMRLTHLPELPRWQLLAEPLDRGTWLRQPLLRPSALAFGVTLEDPRSPIERVSDTLSMRLDNPGRVWVHLAQHAPAADLAKRCADEVADAKVDLACDLAAFEGRRVVTLWGSLVEGGDSTLLGSVLVDLP